MKLSHWLMLLAGIALAAWGYSCHVERTGVLKGEIKARGESIKQLSELAAAKRQAYSRVRKAYTVKPSLETCSIALTACEALDSTNQAQIGLLNKQIVDLKKLNKRSKLFGFLPRPTVQVGVCVSARGKIEPCISGGIPITR